jgi:hypothetical protein
VNNECTDYTAYFGAGAAFLGYLRVLVRRGPFAQLSDAVKDEILREVAFYGILGVIAGAILDYA